MKQFSLFILSFIVLFGVLQVITGWLLTLFYVPDVDQAWQQASELSDSMGIAKRIIGPEFITAVLAAIGAYVIPKIVVRR